MCTCLIEFIILSNMITKWSAYLAKSYCNTDISQIEGYEDAISSAESYTCHHALEYLYTQKELEAMNMYLNVSPDFLIWMPTSVHRGNPTIHAGISKKRKPVSAEARKRMGDAHRGKKRSPEFCKKMSEQRKGEGNPMFGKTNKLVNGKRIFD